MKRMKDVGSMHESDPSDKDKKREQLQQELEERKAEAEDVSRPKVPLLTPGTRQHPHVGDYTCMSYNYVLNMMMRIKRMNMRPTMVNVEPGISARIIVFHPPCCLASDATLSKRFFARFKRCCVRSIAASVSSSSSL